MNRKVLPVAVAALIIAVLTSCGTGLPDKLKSEMVQLKVDSDAYVAAGNKIDAAIRAGAAQYVGRFEDAQKEVRAADNAVQADLDAWQLTGAEPVMYSTHATALRAAQNKVLVIAAAVAVGVN